MQNFLIRNMKKVFNEKKTIAYLFGDLSYGGSNIQGIKTIQYSGYLNDCIIISLKGKADKRFIEFIKKNNILYYEIGRAHV